MKLKPHYAKQLRAARQKVGSQETVAKAAGVRQGSLSAIERGNSGMANEGILRVFRGIGWPDGLDFVETLLKQPPAERNAWWDKHANAYCPTCGRLKAMDCWYWCKGTK